MNVFEKKGGMHFVKQTLIYIILGIFTFMALYPLLWLLISSFKTTQEYQLTSKLALPKVWWWKNYYDAWIRGNFGRLFLNSIFYTGVSTIAILYCAIGAGFAFAKLPSRATGFLYKSFVVGVLITLQCIMIPLFFLANWTGLYDTRLGVLLCYIGVGMPMGIYLSTEFIRSIPGSLIESARIDGAPYLKIFLSIIVPMSKPVAMTLAILTITGTWNEFMLINILASSEGIKSLPVGVQKFSGALASDYGKQFAALMISIVPMIIFYVINRKEITNGVAAGAVKG
ncbi:MAG: carbohydrate ABC transporter permease [Treponema sp.]|nr:carbohydrate ABC transporter permease [Treponema sp.]